MKKIISIVIFSLVLTGCFATTNEAVDLNVRPENLVLNCNEGFNEYTVRDTSLEFCMDPAWGEVVIEDVPGTVGELVHVSFTDFEGGIELWYESSDYEPAEGGKNYADIETRGFTMPEWQIKEQMMAYLGLGENDLVVKKVDVAAIRAARVTAGGKLSYYVPLAFDNYNLLISADEAYATELDEFAFDTIF